MPRRDCVKRPRKAVVRCVAANCVNTSAHGVSFHCFPRDPTLRKQWTNFVKVKRIWSGPKKYSTLCSDHFTEDCFPFSVRFQREHMTKPKKISLTPDAVPTIHVESPVELESCTSSSHEQALTRRMPKLSVLSPVQESVFQSTPPKKLRRGYLKREAARVCSLDYGCTGIGCLVGENR